MPQHMIQLIHYKVHINQAIRQGDKAEKCIQYMTSLQHHMEYCIGPCEHNLDCLPRSVLYLLPNYSN